MKYEFHVGDYVEMVGGFIGWVYQMRDDGWIWVVNKDDVSCNYHIPEELKYFNRIGKYDFTKKNESKIEPLIGKNSTDYCNCELMWNKINELVEVVNQLKEKVDEMAQS